MKGLDGKTAIISGGATLIGEGCASVLAGYGVNVVIADINQADGQRVAGRIGGKASFVHADITSDDDIEIEDDGTAGDDDDTFLEEDEEGDDDVSDLIDGDIEGDEDA